MLVNVNWISMPNVIARREIVREFIQRDATPEAVAMAANELLQNEEKRQQMKNDLARVASSLGERGASRRAAEWILKETMRSNP
jgi:lipid-A-disaccharide synthase